MLDPKNASPGEEQYEYYTDRTRGKRRCQYDYRDHDGKLFSCVRLTLDECRAARDEWLKSRQED